jgi:hypothetical protein
LVWHARNEERLNEGQAGLHPGKNAIDVVIQKEMKYFFSSITHTGLVAMDNDAKSCYDRIICNLAMIISQYFGIKSTAARTQAITLKKMHFRLCTALGDSINHYSHSDDTPVHGTGQGSCASPSLWLIISSILMDCFYQGTFGVVLSDKANPILTNYGKLYSRVNGTKVHTDQKPTGCLQVLFH